MKAVIDSMGRVVVPKAWRVALGLTPGSEVDISPYGAGLQVLPGGRTARVVQDQHGDLVARSDTVVTDEVMYALIDSGRK
ncbi:MAG: AbrB/MazE/SpoVT family DNA-binding domain-containing protein [Bifidobacteriaceae bacterium]|jgi:AbrB family looped-hinge helix DNA binding protein|nr:AbrB/MazE/SpoVT family DNA-binding domain-containing protein [Bifidobacteriaceae bacterium]